MPRLNGTGAVLLGAAGGPASVNRLPLPVPAGLACWLDDDHVVTQILSAQAHISVINVRTGEVVYENQWRGCNQLAAGGGRWLAADGAGVFGSLAFSGYALGLTENDGRGAAGDDGTLAIVRHGGRGFELHSPSGGVVTKADVLARGLCVLGPGRALWHDDDGRLHAIGVDVPVQLPTATNLRVVDVPGQAPWLVSFCAAIGLVAHPWDSLSGVKITGTGESAFYPDARVINGQLRVVYATGPGELPGDLVTVDDAFALPRVDLRTLLAPAPITIPIIGRPLWLGCFNFALGQTVGNCALAVRNIAGPQPVPTIVTSETREGIPGPILGEFVSGSTVEEIEAAAHATPHRAVAYWDARQWPRWPTLPARSWLCLQAYCFAEELPGAFEASLRTRLIELQALQPHQQVALVCQAYTSNLTMTRHLSALVPVFARLARDHFNVIALLMFSGLGRATGLNDHPEVLPLWRALAAGIPSAPLDTTPDPDPEPDPIDPPDDEDDMPIVSEEKFVEYIDAAGEIIVDFFQKIGKPIKAEDGVHGHLEPIVLARQNARSAGDRYRGAGVNATLTDMVMGPIMERIVERTGVPLDAATVLNPLVARIVEAQERLRRA